MVTKATTWLYDWLTSLPPRFYGEPGALYRLRRTVVSRVQSTIKGRFPSWWKAFDEREYNRRIVRWALTIEGYTLGEMPIHELITELHGTEIGRRRARKSP